MPESTAGDCLAIASGKGGTGKTLFATSLALEAARRGKHPIYADADVEEPNGHLLLRPHFVRSVPVTVRVPQLLKFRCSRCGSCVSRCAFDAIVMGGGGPVFFPELCHDCGACELSCAEGVIGWTHREIGLVREGSAQGVTVFEGRLNVGEPRAAPLIEKLLRLLPKGYRLIDCPPGTSCSTTAALRGADRVLLVTEPTVFGAHDLNVALELCQRLQLPAAIVLNRADIGDEARVHEVVRGRAPLLARFPYDEAVLRAGQRGVHPTEESAQLRELIADLYDEVTEWALRGSLCEAVS